jgi:hypothetical protein
MIDKYNLDLKNHENNYKKRINGIYNELRPHYSNFMLTQTKCIYKVKWGHIKQNTCKKRFAVLNKYFI